jgi:hypothetical protein
MAARSGLRVLAVLALLAGGALLILAGALIEVVFLARQNCGSDLNYFGCAVSMASIQPPAGGARAASVGPVRQPLSQSVGF